MFVNIRVREHEVNFTKSSEANMKRMFVNIRVREHARGEHHQILVDISVREHSLHCSRTCS